MSKKGLKKILSVILALIVIVGTFNLPMNVKEVRAATIVASGDCGDSDSGSDVTWTLYSDGVLKISGTGAMRTYGFDSAPWKSKKADIKTIIIEDGVTKIGQYSFNGCSNVVTVSIPDSVTKIGIDAFFDCTSLTNIHLPEELTEIESGAFCNCTSLTSVIIPEKLTSLGDISFKDCTSLKKIEFLRSTPPTMYSMCIPEGVNIIVPDGCKSSYESKLSSYSSITIIEASQVVPPTGGGNNNNNSSSSKSQRHDHSLAWKVTKEPTFTNKGINSLVCTSCGYVAETSYIGNDAVVYNTFANKIESQIKSATAGEVIKIDLGNWHSLPAFIMDRIITCGHDVEITYNYKGNDYDITIPAGKGIDLHIPWYGPLLMNAIYGNK